MISIEERVKLAIARFEDGWTCSQVILSSYCEEFSLDTSVAKAISCGFAGGMRCGETCGVVTAAIMVIGLWSSYKYNNETEQKKHCFEITSKFINDFEKRQNYTKCKDIIGYDIRDVEERKKHPGQQRKICPLVLKNGIEILNDCFNYEGEI